MSAKLSSVEIRLIRPDEHDDLGRLTVDAYRAIDEGEPIEVEGGYEDELAAVARRASVAEVLVAVDGDELLGGITLVPPGPNPMAEHSVAGAASIRMLAVSPAARRRGIARLLTEAALDRARSLGAPEVRSAVVVERRCPTEPPPPVPDRDPYVRPAVPDRTVVVVGSGGRCPGAADVAI